MKNILQCLMVSGLCAVAQSAEISAQGGGLTTLCYGAKELYLKLKK